MKKYFRFGAQCKYDHYVDCESCENLNYLMKKENEKSEVKITEKEDIIANMTKETKIRV